ncbi:MAG: DUF1045 domain-containing protein [Aquitalea sp.]|nr:DUF1045 domain-containing protein [Aquitalea sp.]
MRYAVYLAPLPESRWWRAGCSWLGQDAASDVAVCQPLVEGISAERMEALTRQPARYGWHATLKAPFAPAAGVSQAMLLQQLSLLAQRFQPFDLPLQIARLGDFLALRPRQDCAQLDELATSCVVALETMADRQQASRPRMGLDARQQDLQQRWGYPYVFEQYRCHFTLSDALEAETEAQWLQQGAERHFAALPPLTVEGLALFVEDGPGATFRYLAHCGFNGEVRHVA